MRNQVKASSVSVEVDARPQNDMARTMDKIRGQYEAITDKNRREMEEWYKVKVSAPQEADNELSIEAG